MTGLDIVGRVRRRPRKSNKIEVTTIRDFSGGLNLIDNDLNLDPKFATDLKNMYRRSDGSIGMRNGVRWFADISSVVSGDILDIRYFDQHLIVVTDDGEIAKITGAGVVTAIFNTTIAAALPGAPAGWSTGLTFVSFAQFKGDLVICNGVDKPLLVDDTLAVTYLQDLATGSNVNTPVGKYVVSVLEWVIIAGLSAEPGTIYISNTQSSGTWPLDNAPNDATTKQIDSTVTEGANEITGLAAFRNKLLVFFSDVVVVVALGTFSSTGDHEVDIEDVLPQFGNLSHRSAQNLGDDILFADIAGIPSFSQSRISSTLDPDRASALIDPEIQKEIASISSTAQLERIFSVYHRLEQQYLVFIPNADTYAATTATRCFVYKRNRRLRISAWAEYVGWNWRAAARSDLGRIFFATEQRIFVLGDERFDDEFYADFKDDRDDTWANNTAYVADDIMLDSVDGMVYKCLIGHTSPTAGTFEAARTASPTQWEEYEGEPLDFVFELPWADFRDRMRNKELRYVALDTQGNSQFDLEAYVDNLVFDPLTSARVPALSMSFVAGESAGFGNGPQPFGGGRRAVDERPWGFNDRFKILKLRISGSTTSTLGLKIIGVSLAWLKGSILR